MCGPIELFLTLIGAAATALLPGLFAHDAIGMPIDRIRVIRPCTHREGGDNFYFRNNFWPSPIRGQRMNTVLRGRAIAVCLRQAVVR